MTSDRIALVLCHGDVQPANIIVDPAGEPWLIDFEYACLAPREWDPAKLVILEPPVRGPGWRRRRARGLAVSRSRSPRRVHPRAGDVAGGLAGADVALRDLRSRRRSPQARRLT